MGAYDCDCMENLLSERKNRLDNVNCSEKPNNSKLRSGVLIEGMRMPEGCEVCPMHHFYADTGKTVCTLTHATLAEYYEFGFPFNRHEKCPLVEVKGDGE